MSSPPCSTTPSAIGALTRRIAEQGWAGAYFSRPPHGELAGKTLGLVGLGHIGAAIARRAKAFDMTRDGGGRDARATSAPDVDWIATADRLGELLERVRLRRARLPAQRGDARHDRRRASSQRMKPTALLINVAPRRDRRRGGPLRGAEGRSRSAARCSTPGIAIRPRRPTRSTPSRFPFETLPNVRMTPHSAAWTDGVWERRCAVFAREHRPACAPASRSLNVVRAADARLPAEPCEARAAMPYLIDATDKPRQRSAPPPSTRPDASRLPREQPAAG